MNRAQKRKARKTKDFPKITAPDAFLPDGTPLYFKTRTKPEDYPLQMALYTQLIKGEKT